MSWDIAFPDPIPAPRGKPLATLREARAYITKLPNKQHDEPGRGGPPWNAYCWWRTRAGHRNLPGSLWSERFGRKASRSTGRSTEKKWRTNYKLARGR